jgi:DNA-binding TFAR19-related protein (PDSD5 family)
MDESELDRIRAARLSEMKGSSSGGMSGAHLQGGSDPQKEAEKAGQMEEMRSNMVNPISILSLRIAHPNSKQRCSRALY